MSKKASVVSVSSGYASGVTLEANFNSINNKFDNTLSLDGSSPNAMEADFDLNSYDLLNGGNIDFQTMSINGTLVSPSSFLPEWQGDWATATAYDPYDLVKNNGNVYLCLLGHTSDNFATDLAANKWVLFVAKGDSGGGTGDLLASNNLSDVANTTTALSNLGGQPLSATLTTLSSATAAGLALMDDTTAAAQRTTLGLGTISTQNANNVAISGGSVVDIYSTSTAVDDGTKTTGTYTPTPVGGNFKRIVSNGTYTLAAPTESGDYTMIIQITNGAAANTVTFSGFTKQTGDSLTVTDGDDFILYITKVNGFTHLHIEAMQ